VHHPEPSACDCIVIGGGPAGLTAAIYLARFHLSVTVFDAGRSRARSIPCTRNHAGFPDGISGAELLDRMRRQAERYGADLRHGTVSAVEPGENGFAVTADGETWRSHAVLLATGVINRRPALLDDETHDRALAAGALRYCPVCDGYEVTDRPVALLGTGRHGCDEALFLRSYTADVTLVAPDGAHALSNEQRQSLTGAGVVLEEGCTAMSLAGEKMVLGLDGGSREFDALYPALGTDPCSLLARAAGAKLSAEGCVLIDAHQRTSVAGLYAAGDVVIGLDQIGVAMGGGGIAATTIRNDLAHLVPLRR
jgi:thioredoxin reductase (NADPH)